MFTADCVPADFRKVKSADSAVRRPVEEAISQRHRAPLVDLPVEAERGQGAAGGLRKVLPQQARGGIGINVRFLVVRISGQTDHKGGLLAVTNRPGNIPVEQS